jgi:hypothetical protein
VRDAIPELKELKVGDRIVVEENGYDRNLYLGTVTKKTRTRVSVKYRDLETQFTLDGCHYPFGYRAAKIKPATVENLLLYKKSNAVRMFKNATYLVDRAMRRYPQFEMVTAEQLVDAAVRCDVIAALLEKKRED